VQTANKPASLRGLLRDLSQSALPLSEEAEVRALVFVAGLIQVSIYVLLCLPFSSIGGAECSVKWFQSSFLKSV
jgi:hypothetical protein